jgi:hypothetical protein
VTESRLTQFGASLKDDRRHLDPAKYCPEDRSSFSPAPKYPAAALKQRIALIHPLAQAADLLNILMIRMVALVC